MSNTSKRSHFRWLVVFLLFFILIFNFIDRSAVSFILEHIHTEYNLSDTQLGIIMGSFSIGFILTAFLGGVCLDKFGPKVILSIMVITWSLSMISMALATGFILFLLARILLGLAEGPTFPVLTMATNNWLPKNERVTSLSFILVASTIGIVVSGPIVTILIFSFSWKGMCIVLSIISLIWLPIWIYFFQNKPQQSKYVNQLELDYINNNNQPLNVAKRPALYGKKQILLNIFSNVTILSNLFAYTIFCFFFYFFVSWLPSYFARVYNIKLLEQGGVIAIIWGVASIFMFISGPFLDFVYNKTNSLRCTRSYPIMISSLVPAICIVILLFSDLNIFFTVLLITLAVSCLMLSAPIYYAVNIDIIKFGTGFSLGIMESSSAIAGFIAPVVSGYIVEITNNFNFIFLFLVILGVLNIVNVYFFHHPDVYKSNY